jgi:hypothetical protein
MPRRLASLASLLAVAAAALVYLARPATSDEPPADKAKFGEMMKEWAKMKTPGPQHELLKSLEGTWVGNGTWTEMGMSSKYTEDVTSKVVFDGRFLQSEAKMTSEAAGEMPAMTMTSLMFLGYDNAKQKYVHSMLGDFSTAIGSAEGTYDAATKTFTMTGAEQMGAGKERKFRVVQKIVSKDEWTFEMYFTQPDGKETKNGEAVYKRK